MSKKIEMNCRTYKSHEDHAEPCSVATIIERHRGMLTPAKLAMLLSVSPKSVYARVKAGTLPACTLGTSIRLDPFDTAEWLRAKTA